MWHHNERKLFYFIRKFFYFTFLMVISLSVISFILLGHSFILLGNYFIWILCILVWYYGIKDHLWVILHLYNEKLLHHQIGENQFTLSWPGEGRSCLSNHYLPPPPHFKTFHLLFKPKISFIFHFHRVNKGGIRGL